MTAALTTVTVRFVQAGTHRWETAPEHRAYLRDLHRHLFHIAVSTAVTHDDREIEFHDLIDTAKAVLRRACSTESVVAFNFDTMSCEQIARHVAVELARRYQRAFTVSVYEDNECGATVSS